MSLSDTATPRKPKDDQSWLVSFTDVICLMLTFFVLLFSMAKPSSDTLTGYLTPQGSEQEETAANGGSANLSTDKEAEATVTDAAISDELLYIGNLITQKLESVGATDKFTLAYEQNMIVISFSWPTDLTKQTVREDLITLRDLLNPLDNKIYALATIPLKFQSIDDRTATWKIALDKATKLPRILYGMGYRGTMDIRTYATQSPNLAMIGITLEEGSEL